MACSEVTMRPSTRSSATLDNRKRRSGRPSENCEEELEDEDDEPGGSADMSEEFERLKSFPLQWNHRQSKSALARNGFYFSAGKLVCAFCLAEVACTVEDLEGSHTSECGLVNGRDVNNRPLGDATNYRLEKHRLVSFLVTNWSAPVDPYDLAKWGFYWTGSADASRCTFCRLEVRGWEADDSGESEHLRWNPQCVFMRGRSVGNIPLGEEQDPSHVIEEPYDVTGHTRHLHVSPSLQPGVVAANSPRHPQYASLDARVGSYVMWPISMRQQPQELAEAGFYYSGQGDRVQCFQCGGGLKDWSLTDIPWVEHAIWFSSCPYMLLKKGQEFVTQAPTIKEQNEIAQATANSTADAGAQAQSKTGVMNEAETSALLENVARPLAPPPVVQAPPDLDVTRLCKVCYQNELGIVYLPCGHMATCPDCAPQLSNCPICRSTATAYVRAFLP